MKNQLAFRLRTLRLLVMCFAMWIASARNRALRQARAVATINQCGSVIYYHEWVIENGFGRADRSIEPPGVKWIRRWLGDDYFQRVRRVQFAPSDELMGMLTSMPDVQSLSLDATELTDKGLQHLGKFPNLRQLSLYRGKNLTADSFAVLNELDSLEELYVEQTPLDLACLSQFEHHRRIKSIAFEKTHLVPSNRDEVWAMFPDANKCIILGTEYDFGRTR